MNCIHEPICGGCKATIVETEKKGKYEKICPYDYSPPNRINEPLPLRGDFKPERRRYEQYK
jgi:hypothetical protein